MEASMESPNQVDEFVFRASKRRKVSIRQRPDPNQDDIPITHSDPPEDLQNSQEAAPLPEESDQEELGLNYVIKARKQQQRRQRGGIEFSATRPTFGEQPTSRTDKSSRDPASPGGSVDMTDRFAHQTGYKAQVDKHMMAYIDAELAKRNLSASTAVQPTHSILQPPGGAATSEGSNLIAQAKSTTPHQPPSATTGALQEVEIDARRASEAAKTTKPTKPPRTRLGPDGKPWRSRKPRRNSDDLKRDAMVESFLKENGLNAFERAGPSTYSHHAAGADEDADERAAADFRRQFLEAAEERRGANAATAQSKATTSEISGGPKLGGSRSQRARMHALEREKDKKNAKR